MQTTTSAAGSPMIDQKTKDTLEQLWAERATLGERVEDMRQAHQAVRDAAAPVVAPAESSQPLQPAQIPPTPPKILAIFFT